MKARATRTAAVVTSQPVFAKRTRSAPGTMSRTSSATSTSSGCISEKVIPCASCARIASSTVGIAVAEHQRADPHGHVEVLVAVDVHDVRALAACKYFGATPRTCCPTPLASVCVPPGIRSVARAKSASDDAIDG